MSTLAKRFLTNTALAVLAITVALSFGETVVRLLYKEEIIPFPSYPTDYRYGRYTIRGI